MTACRNNDQDLETESTEESKELAVTDESVEDAEIEEIGRASCRERV